MLSRIRKGDQVIVIAGRDKGARGEIRSVIRDGTGTIWRVVVEGVNVRVRHTKPNPAKSEPGGLVKSECAVHASNVMLYHPEQKRGTRVRCAPGGKGGGKARISAIDGKEMS